MTGPRLLPERPVRGRTMRPTLVSAGVAASAAILLACCTHVACDGGPARPMPVAAAADAAAAGAGGGNAGAGAGAGKAPAAAAATRDPSAAVVTGDALSSRSCGVCHPAIYAEHVQNTHGAAFLDEEARIATREFRRENCVRCHTPRPIAETGMGMVPIERRHDLEEGNTCLSCHAKAGYDYARFRGGPECRTAFDDRVGAVESCATCHRIAGTPEQWQHAREGAKADRKCVVCHMPLVERPVAVGMPPRPVRSHVFPASRSEDQLHRAYAYEARVEGNEVVVSVTNVGAGHNLPTATIQRSLESLVVVKDAQGKEVARDRATFGHPYFKTTGVDLPRPTQIPSGQTREQRVPIPVAAGTVECELLFKIYHPIEDAHPDLSRRLEWKRLAFDSVTPSTHVALPLVGSPPMLPAVSPAEAARPDGYAKYAHLPPGTAVVPIPEGESADDVARLLAILEFPVPGARAKARERLVALGAKAVPALVEALGHWSDETRDQSMALLRRIGDASEPALRAALADPRLYVRYHARLVLARLHLTGAERTGVVDAIVAALSAEHPLDRRSAADALRSLGDPRAAPALRARLDDPDPDVVAAAALALARLGDRDAVPAMEAAFARARPVETRRDLARALAALGSTAGVPALLQGLDLENDVLRRASFDAFFAATGIHESYDPEAPRRERLEAIARIESKWAEAGRTRLRRDAPEDEDAHERAWLEVEALGGGTDVLPGGDDAALLSSLVAEGRAAVPALVEGFSFPSGYAEKRALLGEALGRIGDARAAPALVGALRDPEVSVASWAAWALSTCGDEAAVPALRRWSRRLASLADGGRTSAAGEPIERLLARATWVRGRLGDDVARAEMEGSPVDADAASPPPSASRIATSEAPAVAAPTSPADAVAKAQALRAQDFYEDAVRVLRAADARFGESAPVRLETAWNLLMIAEEDVTRDADPKKVDAEVAVARAAFEEALRMDANVPGQDLLHAKLLRYEGAQVEARVLLRGLVETRPDDAGAHREYADFAFTSGDWSTAEREYQALARLTPKDGWPILYATIAGQWLERPAADLEAGYLEAARRLPEEPMPLTHLAALHADRPDRNAALLEQVIAERPQAVVARVALARLVAAPPLSDRARAERVLADALAIAPRSEAAHAALGAMLAAEGRHAEAVRRDLDALVVADATSLADASAALDRVLSAAPVDAVPADLRKRAWEILLDRDDATGRWAHDAGVWYLDAGHDAATASRYLEIAVAREPSEPSYRRDLDRARAASTR